MENAEIKRVPQINLDLRPRISKISIATQVIGPYVQVLQQGGHRDMEKVMEDLKRNEEIARRLQEAISDIFFFTTQPIDKILDEYFPESPASIKPVGDKKRYYINRYIAIHEELK